MYAWNCGSEQDVAISGQFCHYKGTYIADDGSWLFPMT